MSEKDLCWKCREWLDWATHHGVLHSAVKEAPFLTCCHEPKEKEKCWCVRIRDHRTAKFCGCETVNVEFCPECGKKL